MDNTREIIEECIKMMNDFQNYSNVNSKYKTMPGRREIRINNKIVFSEKVITL